jgi:hypothetical protein
MQRENERVGERRVERGGGEHWAGGWAADHRQPCEWYLSCRRAGCLHDARDTLRVAHRENLLATMGQKYDKAFVAAPAMGSAHGRDMFLVSWDRIIAALSVVLEVCVRDKCMLLQRAGGALVLGARLRRRGSVRRREQAQRAARSAQGEGGVVGAVAWQRR